MNEKFLKDLLARQNAELAELVKRNSESTDVEELRSLGNKIAAKQEEIRATQAQIDALNVAPAFDPKRSMGSFSTEPTANEDKYATMEYRKQVMDYVQRGIEGDMLEFRADATGTAGDLGVILPSTVIQKIQTTLEGRYGTLYSKVAHTNLPGGVKYPLGSFNATFKRITETTKSDRQNAGGVTGSVEFGYNIGEIRLARTLLQTVLSVEAFEEKFAQVIVKAYLKAMDYEIVNGDPAKGECEGVTKSARVTNKIEFTAAEIADWTAWESKLFAEIPLELEDINAEFVMAKQTYVANLCTLKDKNDQPINKAGFDASDKVHKFNEYPVHRVEKTIFKDFDSCANGEVFGMFWLPSEAYAINSNLEFYTKRYYDNETHQQVDLALVINDGKVVDPKYIYLLVKKVAA